MYHFKSLKTRLTFCFLVVTIISVVTAVAAVSIIRAVGIKKREFTKLRTARDLKVNQLESWLEERLGDLSVVAEDNAICALAGDREIILAAGCNNYISKPVEPRKLNLIIRKWIYKNVE